MKVVISYNIITIPWSDLLVQFYCVISQTRDCKMLGDLQGAQRYGSTARCLNIVSTALFCLISLIITTTVMGSIVSQTIRS